MIILTSKHTAENLSKRSLQPMMPQYVAKRELASVKLSLELRSVRSRLIIVSTDLEQKSSGPSISRVASSQVESS